MSISQDFKSIRLRLASPEQVHEWSNGEVIRPETINYRTQKPEKDGLFCEKIFGPTKDWECYCGKYKRIRYKGIVCDKCGVEVTRSVVRRERMGHIDLAVPVTHIWFLRGIPSKVGLILDLSGQALEKVVYFASYIITEVDNTAKKEAEKQVKSEFKTKKKEIESHYDKLIGEVRKSKNQAISNAASDSEKGSLMKDFEMREQKIIEEKVEKLDRLADAFDVARKELRDLKLYKIISEMEYRDLSSKYGHVFKAGIGAEAIRNILEGINLEKLGRKIESELEDAKAAQSKKLLKRLRVIKGMVRSSIRPEWMVVSTLPVIPPDIRPMVPLDGGRYAASDLNDLYRRVINRNNRLKRLQELGAPEVIQRNEKRMLQEAVDALIDNSARRGKAVQASTGQKRTLKSLADMLKGKQGRFRQNLLGKRVDYSGRSVIVVGPKLRIDECGLPKKMALELFKPFIIADLIKNEHAHNVRSAGKLIEQSRPEVWDALEKVIKGHHVLLNRAPTLHRLSVQAFQPVLIEGKAIQLHPAVCPAFNADFDGDQMAVHVPLTMEARKEASEIMLSELNMLKPADGSPVATTAKDMALGCYFATVMLDKAKGEGKNFATPEEAIMAYEVGYVDMRAKINVRIDGKRIETSVGRIIFNEILPKELPFHNEVVDKKGGTDLLGEVLNEYGDVTAARLLDRIKDLAFEILTQSGFSLGIGDFSPPAKKGVLIKEGEEKVEEIRQLYKQGLLTDDERYERVIEIWTEIRGKITEEIEKTIDPRSALSVFIESGSVGNWSQATQVVGFKGLVNNPAGRVIELPIKSGFQEGFSVLEYFIATHGTRKGSADTALKTASSGYLTRRLVDVAQDVIVKEEDCKDKEGFKIKRTEIDKLGFDFGGRVQGRFLASDLQNSKGTVLAKKNDLVDEKLAKKITDSDIAEVHIRSMLSCQTDGGVCQKCYGMDLGRNAIVEIGQAVGIVAAQSIGEPGTQLTMRTFHSGGIAGSDITQGLPRVAELFEARAIKNAAVIAEEEGKVIVVENEKEKKIQIMGDKLQEDKFDLVDKDKVSYQVEVRDNVEVAKGEVLAKKPSGEVLKSPANGIVRIEKDKMRVIHADSALKTYKVPKNIALTVDSGDLVTQGQLLTEGHADLHEIVKVSGWDRLKRYIMRDVLEIYASQGMELDNKHIEIIIRQMLSRVKVTDPGGSEFVPDEVIDKTRFERVNKELKADKKVPAKAEQLLLGISKAALSTESFLSAASFQETARVLIDAAVMGKKDELRGLKENVIIGKLLPAGTGYKAKASIF